MYSLVKPVVTLKVWGEFAQSRTYTTASWRQGVSVLRLLGIGDLKGCQGCMAIMKGLLGSLLGLM